MLLDTKPDFTPPFQHKRLVMVAWNDASFVRAAEPRKVFENSDIRRLVQLIRQLISALSPSEEIKCLADTHFFLPSLPWHRFATNIQHRFCPACFCCHRLRFNQRCRCRRALNLLLLTRSFRTRLLLLRKQFLT